MRCQDLKYATPVIFLKYESYMWSFTEWRLTPERKNNSEKKISSEIGARVLQISDAKREEHSKTLIFPETLNLQGKCGTLNIYWPCPVCDPPRSSGDRIVSKIRPMQDLEGDAMFTKARPWDKEVFMSEGDEDDTRGSSSSVLIVRWRDHISLRK